MYGGGGGSRSERSDKTGLQSRTGPPKVRQPETRAGCIANWWRWRDANTVSQVFIIETLINLIIFRFRHNQGN